MQNGSMVSAGRLKAASNSAKALVNEVKTPRSNATQGGGGHKQHEGRQNPYR